jgi:hypothetical protein
MARDLRPLIASERAALARTRAELDALDRQLASLERSLADADPDPDLCLTKGGDRDDQLRLRPELPVSANAKLRVLNHPS